MSPPDPTLFWSRRPVVSACREGDRLILFDPDAGREKVVNWAGAAIWEAMDGTARLDDLAVTLARRCAIPPTDAIRADACAFADELRRDGFAAETAAPRAAPLPAEDYSWLREAPRALDLSLTGSCTLRCADCF